MWARLDDKLASHPKVMVASATLAAQSKKAVAPFAKVRVLGTFSDVLLYCCAYGTDVFPRVAVPTLADPEPLAVLEAMTTAGLLEPDPEGWKVHDFEDYQPDAQEAKDRRKKDAERKREERARRRAEREASAAPVLALFLSAGLLSVDASTGRPPDVRGHLADASAGLTPDASTGHPADTARRVGAASTVRPLASRARDPVPSRPPEPKPEEPRAAQAPRARLPRAFRELHEVQPHLYAAVHGFLEQGEPYIDADGTPRHSELTAALELLAVRSLETVSPDTRDISAIVDAVLARRQARVTAVTRRDRRDRATLRRLRRIG